MDLLYSSSLFISLVAGSTAVLIGVLALPGTGLARSLIGAGFWAVALAVLSLLTSVVVHRNWGHGPASAAPMDGAQFVGNHTAFLVAGAIVVIGLMVLFWARRRRRLAPGEAISDE